MALMTLSHRLQKHRGEKLLSLSKQIYVRCHSRSFKGRVLLGLHVDAVAA